MKEQDIAAIRRIPLFSGLNDELLRRILAHSVSRAFERGEVLFRQNDPARSFFILLEGWVKVYRLTRAGGEAVIGIFNRGQSFAEAAVFIEGVYPASAETVSDGVLVELPNYSMIRILRESPEMCMAMLAATSRHLHILVQQIEQLKARTGTQRVAEFLTSLCPVEEGPCTIGLPYDKTLIAGRLGMKPESLSRAFSRLRDYGVRVDHSLAAISDVAVLRRYIDQETEEMARWQEA